MRILSSQIPILPRDKSKMLNLFSSMAFPNHLKLHLINFLKNLIHPMFKDPVVFMILVLIVMFQDPGSDVAQGISNQFWMMLTRRVRKMIGGQGECLETTLHLLRYCVDNLPGMTRLGPEHF